MSNTEHETVARMQDTAQRFSQGITELPGRRARGSRPTVRDVDVRSAAISTLYAKALVGKLALAALASLPPEVQDEALKAIACYTSQYEVARMLGRPSPTMWCRGVSDQVAL